MEAFITGLHVVLCLFLILVVLLQPGKGADFGAAMGGTSTAQTGSAAQGATLIGKLTAVVASLFMVTSMALAWFSNQGHTSVITDDALQQELEEQEAEDQGTETPDAAPTGDEEAPEGSEAPDMAPEGDTGDEAGNPDAELPADEAPADEGAADEAPADEGAGDEAPADEGAGDEGAGDEAPQ